MKDYLQMAQDGFFPNFKSVRDKLYGEKARAYDAPDFLGVEIVGNLMVIENTDGFWEVANKKKCELLGVIYYHKPWKKYVWEQCEGIIMAQDCLDTVSKIITHLPSQKNNIQQPEVKACQGEGGCPDDGHKLKSGFEGGGKPSKNPSADSEDKA